MLAGCATANTGEAELLPARTPIRVWSSCSGQFAIVHRIVTHDTPRARDLYGKLRIRRVGGDPTVVRLATGGRLIWILGMPLLLFRPYTLGQPIAVVEPGHVGGGVHTWHQGVQPFAVRGVKPGFVELEAEVDPDPEVPEGEGVPTKRVRFRIDVPKPSAIRTPDRSWNDLDWKTVVPRGDGLRVKVDVARRLDFPDEIPCSIRVRMEGTRVAAEGTLPAGTNVPLNAQNTALVPGGMQIRITLSEAELVRNGLVSPNPADGRDEYTTIDMVGGGGSNQNDSQAFDDVSRVRGGVQRGKARTTNGGTDGNIAAVPPEGSVNLSFMQAAGAEIVRVDRDGLSSEKRMFQNQADALYYSGHGNHSSASVALAGGAQFGPLDATGNWNQELERVFFAGCAVLDIKNYNGNSFGFWGNPAASPGEKWLTVGPRLLFGYNYIAPLDDNVGQPNFTAGIVARYFGNRGAGLSEAWSWGKANQDAAAGNPHTVVAGRSMSACAIDLTVAQTAYWYFAALPGGGYKWTKRTPPW